MGRRIVESLYRVSGATLTEGVNYKFVSVTPDYTGGGIYVFTGKLSNGNYFMADTGFYDVRILDDDPDAETGEVMYLDIMERNIDSVEWQEAHLVKDLKEDECVEFFLQMFKWVEANKPEGNYSMGEFKYYIDELKGLRGKKNWR